MEGMVNDLQLAREKQTVFADWRVAQNRVLPYDLVVSVLTIGYWPTYKASLPLFLSLLSPAFSGHSYNFRYHSTVFPSLLGSLGCQKVSLL